jgi:hypothetical protein
MFCGSPPFLSDDVVDLSRIVADAVLPRGPLDEAPDDLVVFVRGLLTSDRSKRWTWRDVWESKFLTEVTQTHLMICSAVLSAVLFLLCFHTHTPLPCPLDCVACRGRLIWP